MSTLLEIDDLHVEFRLREGTLRAVDGVSFDLREGETLGVVGESGCGKSVTALSILRLVPQPPGVIAGGGIRYQGVDLLGSSEPEMQKVRGKEISMIFQEPMSSLNPVVTVGRQISELFTLHEGLSKRDASERAVEMLRLVRIPEPEHRVREYPHQLSGGMRQRVMIAMALACDPRILLADEPPTALDVTIQAQILDLMAELREKLGTAIVLITHDMGIIAENAERVVVMYAGRKVEEAEVRELFSAPCHPYTQGLLTSIPPTGRRRGRRGAHAAERDRGDRSVPVRTPRGLRIRAALPVRDRRMSRGPPCAREEAPRPLGCLLACRSPARGSGVNGARTERAAGLPGKPALEVTDLPEKPTLEVTDLRKHFPIRTGVMSRVTGHVHAVDGVSFSIRRSETLGLVGESGCGKSTAGRTVLKLMKPTSGTIQLHGRDITHLGKAGMRPLRRKMQLVFQDPFSSLNPRMSAGDIVGEPLSIHGLASGGE